MTFAIVQTRIIAALLIREMSTRFGTKFGGYAWAIVDPAAHIILLSIIFSARGRYPPLGISFSVFYACGYLAMQYYTTIASQISGAIDANRVLLTYPIMAPIDFVIARYILQLLTMTIIASLILSLLIVYTEEDVAINFHSLILPALIASLMGVGIGCFNVVAFQKSTLYERAYSILTRPMFIISGVIFIPDNFPQPYRDWILWNPVAHVIMWFRQGIYPYYRAIGLDKEYLIICSAISLAVGLSVFTMSRSLREKQ